MPKLSLYQKLVVYTTAVFLGIFAVQFNSYSQFPSASNNKYFNVNPKLSVDQVYNKTLNSLVWIVSKSARDGDVLQGSGVLINEDLKLAVTNHHVTKDNDEVAVCFPVRDRYGILIDDREFYLDENNLSVLIRLGYVSAGRVIAKEPKTDLAIIQLEGIPDSARAIEHNFNYRIHLYMDVDERVQIFGNPGGLQLWKWTAGFYQEVDRGMLKINAGVYKGTSGGPVLNDQGELIGIATLSNERHTTWAVPATYIKELLNTLQPRQVFSIHNNTAFTVYYQVKWFPNSSWDDTTVKSNQVMNHWYNGPSKELQPGYPKIRFDHIANDKTVTYKGYGLQTYTRNIGDGVEPTRREDARKYQFGYNSRTKKLDLYDSEKQ